MGSGGLILVMFILVMVSFFHKNCILVEGRNLTMEEYKRMKEYMRSLNKPSVKSIKTEYGVYDCVDIYRQPAFDHPSLKNHTLQVEPSSYPKGVGRNNTNYGIQNIGLKDGGCPNGTVPIRRIRKNSFLHSDSHLLFWKDWFANIHYYSTVGTTGRRELYGTRAYMNVWNPNVPNAREMSLSQLWLIAGPTSSLNTIEVGWMVYPRMYGDAKTRLFVHWTVDDYRKTGCYNLFCPGFVQVNKNIPVDGALDRVSTFGGPQYHIKIDVFKDPKSGNWFLMKDDLAIGYWPNALFNHLNTKAEIVTWGGETTKCGGCAYPAMGSGQYPHGGYGEAAYMMELKVVDNPQDLVMKDPDDLYTRDDEPNCYMVKSRPYGVGPLSGHHIFFGGPGGTC